MDRFSDHIKKYNFAYSTVLGTLAGYLAFKVY